MATWYRRTYGRGRRRLVPVCRVTVPANYAATLVGLRYRLGLSQEQLAAKVGHGEQGRRLSEGRNNWAYHLARMAENGDPNKHYAKITALDAIEAKIFNAEELADAERAPAACGVSRAVLRRSL